jgi:predicted dehydrogenase
MARKLRLGLIGTGVAARLLYWPQFQKLGHRIELVACTNRTRAKAQEYAALTGIPRVVDTAEELIALPEVEAVLISLPIDQQPRYVLAALGAGKAVLSEKPIAASVEAGEELLKASARFQTPWLVGENYAFMPHVRKMRQWLADEELGQVRLVQAAQIAWVDEKNPYFQTAWRAAPKHIGGFVVDGGVHVAEVVRSCFGMPVTVKNLTKQFNPALPPLDTAVAVLEFASGAVGTWTSCFAARHEGPMLRVYGSKANAELGSNMATLRPHHGEETVFRAEADSFYVQFDHFADMVLEGAPPFLTPADALADLQLMDAIIRAH